MNFIIMNQMILVSIRNFLVDNFFVKINGFYSNSNNKFYSKNSLPLLFLIFQIIPFFFIKNLFNLFKLQIIYEVDGIHNITNILTNRILPIILKFEIINNESIIDLTHRIKYYNSSLPMRYIIENNLEYNNFTNTNLVKIKYLSKGKVSEKIFNILDLTNLKFYNLFEN